FEAFVADASHGGREAGDLIHHLRGMRVVRATGAAELLRDELNDLPVGFGFAERFKDMVEALDAALCADEGAFFFERGRGGEDEVGEVAGLGEEDVLHYKEV